MSFLGSPHSGTVIAGRARLFYTRWTCLSCEIIGALLIAILFWVRGIRAQLWPNHTSFCWIMAAVLSKSWRKVLNFWTSHPPSRNIIPLFTSVVLRNPHVPFGSYRLPACRYPSDPSGSLSAEFSAPWTEGQLTGVGRVWGVSQLSYFPKRYIRSWTVSFLGSPHSGTVIAGRARLFYTRWTCLSCEIIGALLIAILFWVRGIRAQLWPNHTSFCWIMAAVLSKSWRKVLNFWT